MLRLSLAFLLAATAGLASAQHRLPDAGVFFDDFHYRNAQPPVDGFRDRPASENALFGLNPWCLDLACEQTVTTRGWYWYNYFEPYFQRVDSLTALSVEPNGEGTFSITALPGRHRVAGTSPRQIATGFAARTGTWAARVSFSDLPNGLPPDVAARDADGRASMMQSFWLISPHRAVLTPDLATPSPQQRFGTTEIDFEFNNWFYDASTPQYVATGYFEGGSDPDGTGRDANTMQMRASDGAPPYSCRIRQTQRGRQTERIAPADVCAGILAGRDPDAGPGVASVMAVRSDGERVRFELRASWERPGGSGVLDMETAWYTGPGQPSQYQTMMLSFYLEAAFDEGIVDIVRQQQMRADWVYHTPDATRSLGDIAADVRAIRERRGPGGLPAVPRLYTIPDAAPARSLSRPYQPRRPRIGTAPAYEPLSATEPVRIDTVLGPRTAPLRGETLEYVAVLERRAADYRFEWRSAPLRADGTAGAASEWALAGGFRWRPAFDAGTAPCMRLDVRATRLEYVQNEGGVSWRLLQHERERAEASVVTCRSGAPRPPGT